MGHSLSIAEYITHIARTGTTANIYSTTNTYNTASTYMCSTYSAARWEAIVNQYTGTMVSALEQHVPLTTFGGHLWATQVSYKDTASV